MRFRRIFVRDVNHVCPWRESAHPLGPQRAWNRLSFERAYKDDERFDLFEGDVNEMQMSGVRRQELADDQASPRSVRDRFHCT